MKAGNKNVVWYHTQLVKLCASIAAINDDGCLFDRLTRRKYAKETNNQRIRWLIEDDIRALLRKHGDYPQ